MTKRLLTTQDVRRITGWSTLKVRNLIASNKLRAINISCSDRPYWQIPVESLEALLSGDTQPTKSDVKQSTSRRQRIDANVPKVFA